MRDSHSCEQELFLSVEGKGSPSKAPMISYNPSDMEAGVMIALRRDNIDLVSEAALNARHFRRLFASSRLLVRSTMRWRKG